ncbi:hypothetical protein DPMN_141609 [Dreissena polymorpha]|uniref:Uncharacterized protein n=1 Tax=Dreissena polymorpha TaxID=45954 RepID=A0A9D4GA17_DREPO|nr:hypothetical protein DPMN_141609 [Dreissena polymorpha]
MHNSRVYFCVPIENTTDPVPRERNAGFRSASPHVLSHQLGAGAALPLEGGKDHRMINKGKSSDDVMTMSLGKFSYHEHKCQRSV